MHNSRIQFYYAYLLANSENLRRYSLYAYNKAIKIETNFYEAWNNQGYALSNLGRDEEAIASFDQAWWQFNLITTKLGTTKGMRSVI